MPETSSSSTATSSTGSPLRCSSARRSTARKSISWWPGSRCPPCCPRPRPPPRRRPKVRSATRRPRPAAPSWGARPPSLPARERAGARLGARSRHRPRGRRHLLGRHGARRRVLASLAGRAAAGGASREVKLIALAAHSPEAVRAALAARGWDAQPAWFAATGIQSLVVLLDNITEPEREALVRWGIKAGADVLTGDGWALVSAAASRLAPLARPDRSPAGLEGWAAEEIARVVPVIGELARRGLGPVSVDTRKAAVARAALAAGALVVNDVSGLSFDPELAAVAAAAGAGVIVMHMRGTPDTMDSLAVYRHVAADVAAELAQAAARAETAGVARERIVVDPGFGFAKTPEQNFRLLDELATVVAVGYPVAVGPSRKRFLGAATGRPVEDRDRATAVACALAWERGARLFRVHEAALANEALRVASATTSAT